MNSAVTPILSCAGLAKTFGMGSVAVPVLRGIDFDLRTGESVAIVGASGSGKSTLLHLLGGLDRPSSGTVRLLGEDFSALDPAAQGRLRNRALGLREGRGDARGSRARPPARASTGRALRRRAPACRGGARARHAARVRA